MQLTSAAPLPVIPAAILQRHHVLEPTDTRFRANARLLQSLWRNVHGLPVGHHRTRRGGQRRLGSRLSDDAAQAGRNFLTPALARLAQHTLIYRQPGALIEQARFLGNLLSSQSLTLNLFGPLALDHSLAEAILRHLLPKVVMANVIHVGFEYSPRRSDGRFTSDATAFDATIFYQRPDGGRGVVAIETKYAESTGSSSPGDAGHLDDLAEASGLFRLPAADLLGRPAIAQLARENLLAQAMIMHGLVDEAHFVLIAPQHNDAVTRAAVSYSATLATAIDGVAPFAHITLEQVLDTYAHVGQASLAAALHDRYLDWSKIDRLIAEELGPAPPAWPAAVANSEPLALPIAA